MHGPRLIESRVCRGSMPHAHLKMALPAAVTGLTDGGAWPDAIIVSRPLPGLGAPAGSAREPPRSPSVLRSAASKCRLCHAPHATAHPTNRAKPTPRAQAGSLLAPGAPGACGGVAPVPGAGGGGARCPARGLLWCIVELVPLLSWALLTRDFLFELFFIRVRHLPIPVATARRPLIDESSWYFFGEFFFSGPEHTVPL